LDSVDFDVALIFLFAALLIAASLADFCRRFGRLLDCGSMPCLVAPVALPSAASFLLRGARCRSLALD
jgi:hypothetical protein